LKGQDFMSAISEILEKIEFQKWSAITIQILILYCNATLFFNGKANGYIFASATFIFSLFLLQVVSRRFLLLYPRQQFFKRITVQADTYIISIFMMFALFLLLIGAGQNQYRVLANLEIYFNKALWIIVPILIFGFPIYWLFKGRECIQNKIIQDLQNNPVTYIEKCPVQNCPDTRNVTIRAISQNLAELQLDCPNCGQIVVNEFVNIAF
jgi:hypothetical protein